MLKGIWFGLLFLLLLPLGCSHAPSRPLAEVQLSAGDARVGTYVSSWQGFRTSSYWIEGPTGLVLIDTQFLLTEAVQALEWAEKTTGKKVVLAIVLHPNPDKFNGTLTYQKRGIRVVTSSAVAALIPKVHALRTEWFYDRFKPDYPVDVPKPEALADDVTTLEAAGLKLRLHRLGKGCSDAHLVVEWERNVFVGDLVTIGFHSWLELGELGEWLKRIEEIKRLKPLYVRTGRGGSGDADALDAEAQYLKTVRALALAQRPRRGVEPSDPALARLSAEIAGRYSGYAYPSFVEMGIGEVWAKLGR